MRYRLLLDCDKLGLFSSLSQKVYLLANTQSIGLSLLLSSLVCSHNVFSFHQEPRARSRSSSPEFSDSSGVPRPNLQKDQSRRSRCRRSRHRSRPSITQCLNLRFPHHRRQRLHRRPSSSYNIRQESHHGSALHRRARRKLGARSGL